MHSRVTSHGKSKTPEELEAQRLWQEEWARVRAEHQRQRQEGVRSLMMMVDELLEKWKGATDKLDAHFLYFEGWTRATVCELPVHERAAKLYAERFRRLAERAERPLTLQELDNVVETTRRRVPTHQAVLRTTQHLEGLAQQCVDHEDIDFVRFVQLAMKRAKRVRGYNDGTESAIIFVCSAIAQFVQDTYY